jgi:SnoaL-like domain
MASSNRLTSEDRFEIFEQINLHQRYIDNDASRESATKYVSLYWEDATFTVIDIRRAEFNGMDGLKQLYDYAHSVFPLHKMRHALGTLVIEGTGNDATAEWNWIVTWKDEKQGFLSTGTYSDKFQKRNGVWKCSSRISNVDPNFPATVFQPWIDQGETTFKAS